MKSLYPRCGALDVHKETVVACARVQQGTRVSRDVATFATTTAGLLALADWLAARRCSPVALEATGVYWKPIWHVLEGRCELVLANAAAVRNVPGRKSDVNDAVWLADLLAHGLIRASFVPPAPIQALRDLTRTRKQLVRQVAQHTLRLQKTLEDANLKITGIVTDLLGPSGRAILRALIAGETDPERLLAQTTGAARALARRTPRRGDRAPPLPPPPAPRADRGLERAIAQLEGRVAELIAPLHESVARLTTIPGVSHLVAHVLVAEVGLDMSRFPSPAHLRSWAGLCPRLDESAGKRRSTRLRPGAPWLKTTLVQAAWAAVKVKQSYFRAQFLRLRARRGPKRAIVAVAASLLTAVYCMLRDGTPYHDLGATYFDERDRSHILKRLTRRIEALGYHVAVRPAASVRGLAISS
jgi:transposase